MYKPCKIPLCMAGEVINKVVQALYNILVFTEEA